MELDDLKHNWQAEDKHLDHKINLNENLLLKMNLENTTGELNKIISMSLLGRNLALIYCLVSMALAILMLEEIAYSIPAIVGSLAMLGSFVSHLSIEKPDYRASLLQLQKAICQFRIHTAATFKYDIVITVMWILTFLPIWLRYFLDIPIYRDLKGLSIFCLISVVVLTLVVAFSRKSYKENEQKLKSTEAFLTEIIQFEGKH